MTDQQSNAIDEIVEQLLYDPPHDAKELRQRFGDVEAGGVRKALMERIEEGELDDIDAIVAGNVFDVMGFGEQRERLVDIVSSPMPDAADEHRRARKAAFVVLAMHTDFDPDDPDSTFGLSADQYTELAASVYASLFEFTERNIDLVFDFGQMLLQEPSEVRPDLFETLESYRTETNVQAGILYRPLLEDDTYRPLWPLLVDAVVEEGVPRDAQWLERAAEKAGRNEDSQRFRKAAMELRTKGLKDHHLPEGFALVGTPDGAGSFPIFVFTERDNGVYAGHNVVIRHQTHTIRDGFFIPNIIEEEIEELAGDLEETQATQMTRVAVEVGIHLAQIHIGRASEDFGDLPPETRLAIYRLERLPTGGADLPHVPAADALDEALLRQHFDEDRCFESWFFDQGTLDRAQALPLPKSDDEVARWKSQTAKRLADVEDIVERTADNLEAISLWYVLDGQQEVGEQFVAAAEQMRENFAGSLATDILLDNTLDAVQEMHDYAGAFLVDMLGDDSLRAELHDLHLEGKNYDAETEENYLDYMELSFQTISNVRPELPKAVRPSYDQMQQAAGPIGLVMANFFGQPPLGPPDELAHTVSDELSDAGIPQRLSGLIVPELLTNGRLLSMIRE